MRHRDAFLAMANSPAEFRLRLLIDADHGPVRLGDVIDDWQARDFEALDPAWMRVAGLPADGGPSRAWLERPRGHSKTADIAVMVVWALAFSLRKITGIAAAVDRDQARLLRDAVDRLIRLNPWLGEAITVQQYRVLARRTGSTLDIISSDAPTSYGMLPDFVVCDELTHWRGSELWNSLFSSAAKRSQCLLVVIGNAGFGDSWQYPIRQAVRSDPDWYFSRLDGPQASWITADRLAEQERLLPPTAYKRLWLNEWASGAGDVLDPILISAAITRDGPMAGGAPGFGFVAGLDLGVKNDRSALAVVGCHFGTGRVCLAECKAWSPGVGREIDLADVEEAVLDAQRRFNIVKVCVDPWQAAMMTQRLRRRGVNVEEVYPTVKNLTEMATSLLNAFTSYSIDLYDEPLLLRDLGRLSLIEKATGYRLTARRDSSGHADRAIALALCLPHATRKALSAIFLGDCHPHSQKFPSAERNAHGVQLSVSPSRVREMERSRS